MTPGRRDEEQFRLQRPLLDRCNLGYDNVDFGLHSNARYADYIHANGAGLVVHTSRVVAEVEKALH